MPIVRLSHDSGRAHRKAVRRYDCAFQNDATRADDTSFTDDDAVYVSYSFF